MTRISPESKRGLEFTNDPLLPPPPRDPAFDFDLGAWALSRYADVLAAFREPALRPTAARSDGDTGVAGEAAQQTLRKQVLVGFSSPKLNGWQARFEGIADGLPLEPPLDLVTGFAEPWCLAAAEIVTGSDPADRAALLSTARIVSAAAAEPRAENLQPEASLANAELKRYFQAAAIPMAAPTFVALSRTVACLLASGWLALLRHPATLAQLRAGPEQIPMAVEEILRYACIPQSVSRYASRPIALRSLEIAGGNRLILRLASANRDPLQFSDPNRFDFTRRGSSQLSLGFGSHSCVGAALIRMTAAAATRVFVERFGSCEICSPVEWQGGEGFRSPATLRVH